MNSTIKRAAPVWRQWNTLHSLSRHETPTQNPYTQTLRAGLRNGIERAQHQPIGNLSSISVHSLNHFNAAVATRVQFFGFVFIICQNKWGKNENKWQPNKVEVIREKKCYEKIALDQSQVFKPIISPNYKKIHCFPLL